MSIFEHYQNGEIYTDLMNWSLDALPFPLEDYWPRVTSTHRLYAQPCDHETGRCPILHVLLW